MAVIERKFQICIFFLRNSFTHIQSFNHPVSKVITIFLLQFIPGRIIFL